MLTVGGTQREKRWKVTTLGQYRPHAMGGNARVFVREWKSKRKEERRRRKEERRRRRKEARREGSELRLQRGSVSEWKNLSLFPLSVCMHGLCLLQRVTTFPAQTQQDSSDFKLGVNILQKPFLKVQLLLSVLNFVPCSMKLDYFLEVCLLAFSDSCYIILYKMSKLNLFTSTRLWDLI